MMDVAAFEVMRSVRRADLVDTQRLDVDGPLTRELDGLLSKQGPATQLKDRLGKFASDTLSPLPFADGDQPPQTATQFMFALLGQSDRWLARLDDRPDAAALNAELKRIRDAYSAYKPSSAAQKPKFEDALKDAQEQLADWAVYRIAGQMLADVPRTTRLLIVGGLVARIPPPSATGLDPAGQPGDGAGALKPGEIWDLLNRRVPVLPKRLMSLFPKARVELVREASVSDLHVVRSEWRCYVPGEIAAIRNVMAGEAFRNEQKQIREQEVTVTAETVTTARTERTDEQAEQSELSRQINTNVQAQVSGFVRGEFAQGTTEYNYYKISGGADGSLSVTRSEQQASRIARQSVARAVSSVESQTREARLQRTLSRTEDTTEHKFTNEGNNARRGVYRWVDRVDRYQVFRYPNRLQLEFQLPEPAEYYRWRTQQADQQLSLEGPPAWDLEADDIAPDKMIELAVKFRAANLPVPLEDKISIVQVVEGAPDSATLPNDATEQWRAPDVLKEFEIAVPDGYLATQVSYAGLATAVRARWHREATSEKTDGPLEGFHSLLVNVLVGTSNRTYVQGGRITDVLEEVNTVQGWGGAEATNKVQFGEATLNIRTSAGSPVAVPLDPGAAQKLKLGVHAIGVASVGITFFVECTLTQEAKATWQQGVCDALFAAWSQWNREWSTAQTQRALALALPTGESSALRNAQLVRDELKRQIITWLLQETPFQGRNLLGSPSTPDSWRDINIAASLTHAPTIQFLEQAFEWANLTYVFYPYYWADRARWSELTKVQGTDLEFERFLKAGSVRGVVSARPGMEAAVHHWLLYQEPFLGLPMPLPGDPVYISIATEIRDLAALPEAGIPGDSWETRLGTTFVWLDESATLPANPLGRLGAPPHEPANLLCPH